ncbi:unnamed protein product [Cyprideis torosa]|uniref:Uncharacterized protein n=1 Tax=Cyprideis torosa TaxID=163714 RepID=A0A7R8WBF3_9CRUS|nr:unnamed protein product [Cyprideis torosa]CAG0892239.1 unnamed protein product [Cyprideis torosa]
MMMCFGMNLLFNGGMEFREVLVGTIPEMNTSTHLIRLILTSRCRNLEKPVLKLKTNSLDSNFVVCGVMTGIAVGHDGDDEFTTITTIQRRCSENFEQSVTRSRIFVKSREAAENVEDQAASTLLAPFRGFVVRMGRRVLSLTGVCSFVLLLCVILEAEGAPELRQNAEKDVKDGRQQGLGLGNLFGDLSDAFGNMGNNLPDQLGDIIRLLPQLLRLVQNKLRNAVQGMEDSRVKPKQDDSTVGAKSTVNILTGFDLSVFDPKPPTSFFNGSSTFVSVLSGILNLFSKPKDPISLINQLVNFLTRARFDGGELTDEQLLELLQLTDQGLSVVFDSARSNEFNGPLVGTDVDLTVLARTVTTLAVESTGLRSEVPDSLKSWLLPATGTAETSARTFPLIFPFNRIVSLFRKLVSLVTLAGRADFTTEQQYDVLSNIHELINIFLESDTEERLNIINKVMSQDHYLRSEDDVWAPFTETLVNLLLEVSDVPAQLPLLRSGAPLLVATVFRRQNATGPFAFRDRFCSDIPLSAITPGDAFSQTIFNQFWRAFWVFQFSNGQKIVEPCASAETSLRQIIPTRASIKVPVVNLPNPTDFINRVCNPEGTVPPPLPDTDIDPNDPNFNLKNWERFYFGYWSWVLTSGTMMPLNCFVDPDSAPGTGTFNFFPLPGVAMDEKGNIAVSSSSSLQRGRSRDGASDSFRPVRPRDFHRQFCATAFPLERILPSPDPENPGEFRQDTFNRFWRAYFTYVFSNGKLIPACGRAIEYAELRSAGKDLLPLRDLPDPKTFATTNCPDTDLTLLTTDAHFHQFFRNYFNSLIDSNKSAGNCLVVNTDAGREANQFFPLLGSTTRERA